jgi:hypothetical protein
MNATTSVKTVAPQFRGIPELDHDKMMAARFGTKLSVQGRLERRIVWNLLKHLEANGWHTTYVWDGEQCVAAPTAKAVMELVFNLDEAQVRFSKGHPGEWHGVYLVLGNGVDIVCDWNYSVGDRDGFDAAMEAFDTERLA